MDIKSFYSGTDLSPRSLEVIQEIGLSKVKLINSKEKCFLIYEPLDLALEEYINLNQDADVANYDLFLNSVVNNYKSLYSFHTAYELPLVSVLTFYNFSITEINKCIKEKQKIKNNLEKYSLELSKIFSKKRAINYLESSDMILNLTQLLVKKNRKTLFSYFNLEQKSILCSRNMDLNYLGRLSKTTKKLENKIDLFSKFLFMEKKYNKLNIANNDNLKKISLISSELDFSYKKYEESINKLSENQSILEKFIDKSLLYEEIISYKNNQINRMKKILEKYI